MNCATSDTFHLPQMPVSNRDVRILPCAHVKSNFLVSRLRWHKNIEHRKRKCLDST